jgi:hypothetical protein
LNYNIARVLFVILFAGQQVREQQVLRNVKQDQLRAFIRKGISIYHAQAKNGMDNNLLAIYYFGAYVS